LKDDKATADARIWSVQQWLLLLGLRGIL
jgi:hypothetical protein